MRDAGVAGIPDERQLIYALSLAVLLGRLTACRNPLLMISIGTVTPI